MHFYARISVSLSGLYQALFVHVYVHDRAQFWTNDGHPRAHTIDSDIHTPYTIQFDLRDDSSWSECPGLLGYYVLSCRINTHKASYFAGT
jgi:hypothetical protein